MPDPAPQELSACHRHPERECPGECQYILPGNACWWNEGMSPGASRPAFIGTAWVPAAGLIAKKPAK